MRAALFEQVGGLVQDFGASLRRRSAPRLKSRAGGHDSIACGLWISVDDAAAIRAARSNGRAHILQCGAVAELDAARIQPLRLIEITRQADVRMPAVG